ncbi:hypothetical protein TH15_06980 [Thalassospira profundimaris]|nr:hypothetical protein TH15_06980 [Thalassospira profundimaris]
MIPASGQSAARRFALIDRWGIIPRSRQRPDKGFMRLINVDKVQGNVPEGGFHRLCQKRRFWF